MVYSSDDGNIGCVVAKIDNSAKLSHKLCCAFAHSKTSQVGSHIISLYFKNDMMINGDQMPPLWRFEQKAQVEP